jgi:TBC1 domain family member 25
VSFQLFPFANSSPCKIFQAKAFEIRTVFNVSYTAINPNTRCEETLTIFSDWDLDAAFLRASNLSLAHNTEPTLFLQIDVKPFSEQPDWDAANTAASIISTNIQQSIETGQKYVQNKLPGLISMVSRAFNLADDPSLLTQCSRPPLSDNDFRYYCDSVGMVIHQTELRKVIYAGGIDPSLRRVVWKHILNVYPENFTGKERMDYMKRKSAEYCKLREAWRLAVKEQGSSISGELAYVTSMIRKDVLRTDRHHPFYAGNDDNQNVGALFNVLTTYALSHPSVSYCQGMSDICSTILVTMCDEGQAYICFCALMKRLKSNFMIDGIAMTTKFSHLSDALQYYDYEFYNYLKKQQADDLLFCYRWLLLEMKREFAFEDSLRMLEILWSSLPPDPPEKELLLFEREFIPSVVDQIPADPKSPLPTESPYTKVCEIRRQNSAMSISNAKLDTTKRMNQSLDETKSESSKVNITKTHQSLDESKLQTLRADEEVEGEEEKPATDSPVVSESTDNPFVYSDSTDADLPSGSSIASPTKTITRGGSISETLKELRDKLVASKIGISNTIEKLEEDFDPKNAPEIKLVKNFNEFLNFAKRRSSNASQEQQQSQQHQLTVDRQQQKTDASPDDSQDYYPITTSVTRGLKLELENLNRQVFGQNFQSVDESPRDDKFNDEFPDKHPYIQLDVDAIEVLDQEEGEKVKMRRSRRDKEELAVNRFSVASSTNNDVFIWQNPLNDLQTTPDEQTDIEYDGEIIEMDNGKKSVSNLGHFNKIVSKNSLFR